MSSKNSDSREIKGWDTNLVKDEGLKLRFLYATPVAGKFEEGPWFLLSKGRCQALAEELLNESKKI